uniref:alpha-galactosidase n=1 Tax=Aplanochytrium stocchinoi TaxID=215587 RepID=A0A7S3PE74_9STRA
MGRLRFNMGLNPETFRWNLQPGKSFHSPECLMVYSKAGLGEMSRKFHCIVRNRIVPERFRDEPCPILLNSWEASYFDVTHSKIVSLSGAAAKLGIEMIVLDDGWFANRNDATSSLGDWKPDRKKFPFGIRGVAHQVEGEGLKFGIWIEPEMVSIDSELYRAHPEWCLHVPGREIHLGRNQLVLDLTRKEVVDGIYSLIKELIESSKSVSYIKWDMNRHLTEVYSTALQPEEQGEVEHRYVMALYGMHRRLSKDFPDIRIEGCSGGGGRFDLGMLYFIPQIWCSDNTDAMARLRIQHGTSLLYPAQCVGSHYSVVPNHVTQLWTRSRTRAFVAMCGTFGYELDPTLVSEKESSQIMQHIQVFKSIRNIIHKGNLYRLWSPFNTGFCSWLYVRDHSSSNSMHSTGQEAVVFIFNNTDNFWSSLVPRLRLRGLKPDAKYKILEPIPNTLNRIPANLQVVRTIKPMFLMGEKVVFMHGSTLMNAGIPVHFLTRDDCFMLHLVEVPEQEIDLN